MNVLKVVFVGDSGVGKTSIIRAFMKQDISNIKSTIGVDFYTISLGNKHVVIWDFAGQEWFREIVIQFLKGAFVVVMVFDLSRPKTLFNLLTNWATSVKEICEDAYVIVVGNKLDKKSINNELIAQILDELKEKLNMMFYVETSALNMVNIPNVFDAILEAVNLHYKLDKRMVT